MLIVDTVRDLGLFSPHLALGHYIKQICQLSISLQTEDEQSKKHADDFDVLYGTHWNSYVAAVWDV